MSSSPNKFTDILSQGAETSTYIKAYLQSQVELKKIEASKIASKSISQLLVSIIRILFITGISFFLLIALAIYLGDLWNSYVYGVLATSGLILFAFILFNLLKGSLIEKKSEKQVQNIFFQGKTPEKEEVLVKRVAELERQIEENAKHIPAEVQSIQAKDFLPQILNTTSGGKGVKNKILSIAIQQGIKLIRKKLS